MAENEKISIKDIHSTYWRCRDFEIAHLWQRSIFFTAFLVMCFTAYGAILSKLFGLQGTQFIILNLLAYGISLLGIIFSIFWIKMSKGSKAWYEKYENAIVAIERDEKYTTKEALEIGGFAYCKLEKFKEIDIDNSIFSTKAGAYSVSKINIAIGQVFLIQWLIIGLGHIIITSLNIGCINDSNLWSTIIVSAGIILIVVILLIFSKHSKYESSSL
jgi:bacitracin transport system permease protein